MSYQRRRSSAASGPSQPAYSFSRSRQPASSQRRTSTSGASSSRGLFDSFTKPQPHSSSSWGIFDAFTKPGSSSRSFFDFSSSSSRGLFGRAKRRPRDGYISSIMGRIRKALRDALAYARKHPMKVLVPIVMALISGGALTALLKSFGLSLPASWATALGASGRGVKTGYDAWYSSQSTERYSGGGGGGEAGGHASGADWLGTAVKIGSAFL